MARVKGTTTKAGTTRTQPPAQDVDARIERPHGGKSPKNIGPQTTVESQQLRGIPGKGRVREVGPTGLVESGSVGSPGSVRVAGAGNFEDQLAALGGRLHNPATQQSGSVKEVGPHSLEYSRLLEGRRYPLTTVQARFAPKKGRKLDKGVPLLKSGVGRRHAWSVYAGSPGTQSGSVRRVGFDTESLLISGRKRTFSPETPDPRSDLVEPGQAIVLGD